MTGKAMKSDSSTMVQTTSLSHWLTYLLAFSMIVDLALQLVIECELVQMNTYTFDLWRVIFRLLFAVIFLYITARIVRNRADEYC